MAWVLLALGLVFVIEGLTWALAPGLIDRLLTALRDLPLFARRQVGLLGIALGVILILLARTLGF